MQFGKSVLSPGYTRPPSFKSTEASERYFSFECVDCSRTVSFEWDFFISQGYSWHESFGDEIAGQIKAFYRIGGVGKSQDGGFPSMILTECTSCNACYLIYAGVKEVSHSVLVVTMQGITEILEELETNQENF